MKHSGDGRKPAFFSKAGKDEELVKYMSNLPGYLQHAKKGEKHQEGAFSFGVLEWERLEKWKHKKMFVTERHSRNASSTRSPSGFTTLGPSMRLGTVRSESLTHRNGSPLITIEKERRKDLYQRTTSETGNLSSNSTDNDIARCSKENLSSSSGETKKRIQESQDLEFEFPSPYNDEHQNVVLLLPWDLPRNSCSELSQISEPRSSDDEYMANANRKSFSDAFRPRKSHHEEVYSEVSHSCPLPCNCEINPQGNKYAQDYKSKAKVSNSTLIETARRLDWEFGDATAAKGRTPSPSRWFGLGLGRVNRSLSLKEGSADPLLDSKFRTVKSGPMNLEASGSLDMSTREKAHAHSRGRSSPLRRLLNPLLKPKAARVHSADTALLEANLNSVSFKPSDLMGGKEVTSVVHALLQFTIKNGLPLFKFVVDENDHDMLATTVKKLTQSGKDDDSSWIYTFYSVREMKKKKSGGWINQGSRGKSSGYAYNVVGRMKVSHSKDHNLTKEESVLFSVDLEHGNRELAAIVTNKKNASSNGEGSDERGDSTVHECFPEDECFFSSEADSHNTTVVLQDGIHGMPNEGVPSTLIDRWKSGGLCDCGGWDIGCKLRVLTSNNSCNDASRLSKASPITNRFDLHIQGGIRDSKPIFSLVPLKSGIYSIKFNASIPLLQAFAMCVAVLNGEKSSDPSEGASHVSEAEQFQEPIPAAHHRTRPALVEGKSPVRYVAYPPYSPVGRV